MSVSGGDLLPGLTGVGSLPETVISTVTASDPVQVIQQSIDNDTLNVLADKLEVCNTLLLGINDRLDFIIALGVAIAFVAVCYSILKSFSRF